MRKVILAAAAVLMLVSAVPLFAQNEDAQQSMEDTADYYYYSIPIEKIYSYRIGYVVTYRRGVNGFAQMYIPLKWFTESAGKGEMVANSSGAHWPYMTLFYKDGKFDHVRLYVRRSRQHETWGVVPLGMNIDDRFSGVEELKLEY